jgi:SAM-dependent methyltransferase
MNTTPATDRAKTDDWDAHWDKYAATDAGGPARRYRTKLIFELLALREAKTPLRILDLGSAYGELAREVLEARKDAEVVGLDFAQGSVELSRKRVPGAKFYQQDFMKPMTLGNEYKGWATHAVCSEVLEHLDDPETMLRNVRPYMAPGCKLVITVPGGPMSGYEVADLRGAGFPFFNLYRLAVIARGQALITDVASDDAAKLPLSARAMLGVFSVLFKMNVSKTKLGWQMVAVGVVPR